MRKAQVPREQICESLDAVYRFAQDADCAIEGAYAERHLPPRPIVRGSDELERLRAGCPKRELEALEALAQRLDALNAELVINATQSISAKDTTIEWRVVQRVGIYIPYRMPSSAYTYLSAAKAAGVSAPVVYLACDRKTGDLDPLSVAVAARYGAEVWGGLPSLGFPALAFGCGDARACDLICGPCGARLNVLKHISCLIAGCATEMSAGPSTLAIVADDSADWRQVVLDVEAQLEHGPQSAAQLLLVGEKARDAWKNLGCQTDQRVEIIQAVDLEAAARQINELAPETLEFWITPGDAILQSIRACGVSYVRAASSLGDYGAIGRGCADPTGGMARAQSGLSPFTFMRRQPVVYPRDADADMRQQAALLAAYEQLKDHHRAILKAAN